MLLINYITVFIKMPPVIQSYNHRICLIIAVRLYPTTAFFMPFSIINYCTIINRGILPRFFYSIIFFYTDTMRRNL